MLNLGRKKLNKVSIKDLKVLYRVAGYIHPLCYLCFGKFAAVLLELLDPNISDVCKASSANNTEDDQENVCVVVGQHSHTAKILLTSSVPKTALNVIDIFSELG